MPSTKSKTKPEPEFKNRWQFQAIGTHWSIETVADIDSEIKNRISELIENFDKAYSRFRDDSMVMKMAKKAGTYEFPDDDIELFELYEKLYVATDGAVTLLVGDALEMLGYDKDYSLEAKGEMMMRAWEDAAQRQGTSVIINQPVTLDFGAAGKGYLVDRVGQLLEQSGIREYVIDASGDIRHRGANEQIIGLENPFDKTRVIGTMKLRNASLCASATTRRRWGNGLHHVIDGRNGRPTDDIIATWVVADSTVVADGLATALFFAPAEKLNSFGAFHYVRLKHNGDIEYSIDNVGELYV
jgi:thiamine biosynthesis lipoprotein